jgi:hypothetical protein
MHLPAKDMSTITVGTPMISFGIVVFLRVGILTSGTAGFFCCRCIPVVSCRARNAI